MKRFLLLFVLPSTILILLSVWPLVDGSQTLYLRDVLNSHLQLKAGQEKIPLTITFDEPFKYMNQPEWPM